VVLTVSKLTNGQFRAIVDDARSPELGTRHEAQAWAERQAGAK
jgi:hypothetical protein